MNKPAVVFCLLLTSWSLRAQIISENIVGYYNLRIYSGANLIANQLIQTNHSIGHLLVGVPDGSTFTKWDSAAGQFLPVSTFNGATWSLDYSLNLGEGGLLTSPLNWTNTFVGEVGPYAPIAGTNIWAPNYAPGIHLAADPLPRSGTIDAMFLNAIGRAPDDGDSVRLFDPATQNYTLVTYHEGSGWDSNPTLGVGQAAWFHLGVSVVPEPGGLSLLAMGCVWLCCFRRTKC